MAKGWRRCDWRTEDGRRCKKNAQGHVGMLHLCKTCFNTKMLTKPLPLESLRQPLVILTTSEGRPVGDATWIPY